MILSSANQECLQRGEVSNTDLKIEKKNKAEPLEAEHSKPGIDVCR